MMWELVGAVVGAGLASGREISAFFSKYGYAGYAGIAASGVVMYFLGTISYPISFPCQWMHMAWKWMLSALLVVTGGAMLSGAGEVFTLTLPLHGAYWLGLLCTLGFSWLLARKTADGLTHISKAMLTVLLALIALSLLQDSHRGANINTSNISACLLSGIKYGGFNAALQASVLARNHGAPVQKRRSIMGACAVICFILSLGNTALLRRLDLLSEPLPFLKFAASYGRWGYVLFAAALYLAILSTLVVCLKGLSGNILSVGVILAVSLLGFSGVVESVYPLLGVACFLFLLYAKFAKSAARAFHSGADVL